MNDLIRTKKQEWNGLNISVFILQIHIEDRLGL